MLDQPAHSRALGCQTDDDVYVLSEAGLAVVDAGDPARHAEGHAGTREGVARPLDRQPQVAHGGDTRSSSFWAAASVRYMIRATRTRTSCSDSAGSSRRIWWAMLW